MMEITDEQVKSALKSIVVYSKQMEYMSDANWSIQELKESGHNGLARAFEKYRAENNCQFHTYASHIIFYAIKSRQIEMAKHETSPAIEFGNLNDKRRAEHNELIDWVDEKAGFPLGTMLSQGYKGYEIADKVGISRGRVSQIRKEIYGLYKTQNL